MSIEKINAAMPIARNISFKGEETTATKGIDIDEEKSSSMNKMIGLGAAAAIAIGGIIYFAKKGKAPSKTGSAGTSVGESASTAASSTPASAGESGSPVFEPVKKFMKKLEDGTEYLFRTEERDKDGNLVKSVRYAKDGTVERVREFKMFPAGMNTPAHNVVASEIRYGKNGEVIYKRTAHADGLGYNVEEFVDEEHTRWQNITYVTHLDGNRFRPVETFGILTDVKTGKKLGEVQFGPKGEDDIVLMRKFDKKTGTKVVKEEEILSDNQYEVRRFGQGNSVIVEKFRGKPDDENKILLEKRRFDSKGRLRAIYVPTMDGSLTRFENPVKGRATICEEINGAKYITKTYTKDGEVYTQKFVQDVDDPNNSRIEVYKYGELIHTIS